MGLLARALTPEPTETRDWLTNDDYWAGELTPAGVRVTRESALTLSTVWRCVILLTHAIATLPMDIIVQIGPTRFPEFTKPRWLMTPNPSDPTMTAQDHFAQVATSLLMSGNAFTAALPSLAEDNPVLLVLDPSLVEIKRNGQGSPYYEVRDQSGRVVETLDSNQMLHATWLRLPGQMRGYSPLEAARRSIGLGIVAEDFGSRFFGQGAALSFGVEVPGVLTEDQRKQLTESLRKRYAGSQNSHAIGVLTAGAKFVPGLQPTPEQAQFLATRQFSVEDIARWFGVPPHLVGSQEPGASSYNSVEQRSLEFREYGVLPLARRIEDPYQRLVTVPDRLRSTNATAAFRFNLDALARADISTRFAAYSSGIMAGVLKPNEARSLEDLPPTQGGDVTYMQMQMVPTGSSRPPDALLASGGATATPNTPARSDVNVTVAPPAVMIGEGAVRVVEHVLTRTVIERDPVTDKIIATHEELIA